MLNGRPDRLFEWIAAGIMLSMAGILALPGDSFERLGLKPIMTFGLTEEMLAAFLAGIGSLRCAALLANGAAKRMGAQARTVGALAGVFVWTVLGMILAIDSFITGRASLLAAVLACLTIGELFSCYRATYDAGRRGL